MTKQLTPETDYEYGIARCGRRNINSKLNNLDVCLIRELIKEGKTQQYIADMFGVYHTTISQIKTGKTWRWLK